MSGNVCAYYILNHKESKSLSGAILFHKDKEVLLPLRNKECLYLAGWITTGVVQLITVTFLHKEPMLTRGLEWPGFVVTHTDQNSIFLAGKASPFSLSLCSITGRTASSTAQWARLENQTQIKQPRNKKQKGGLLLPSPSWLILQL